MSAESAGPVDLVLARLQGVRDAPKGWAARCPAHDDHRASLSLREGEDGRVLLHCHRGCQVSAVVAALGMAERDLFPPREERTNRERIVATYDYTDEKGNLLYQVVRFDPKDFRQRRPHGAGRWIWNLQGVRRVLYRLPRVLEAAKKGDVIFVAEGEKDVLALEDLGVVATCNPGGAGKWRDEFSACLAGAKGVIVIPDRDAPGEKHASAEAASLRAAGVPVKVVELPKGKDASEWIAGGGTKAALLELVKAAPKWESMATAETGDEARTVSASTRQYPDPISEAAFYGVFGELVHAIEPHTEADPVALLLQALTMFGNVIGRGPYFLAESDRHHGNLFVCLVGLTAKGRKGTSYGRISAIFRDLDTKWLDDRAKSGLSSGEGLIHAVRDPAAEGEEESKKKPKDPGIEDKRLMVHESEFASVLRVMAREGNTLSAVIRQAWETGKLNTLVKHSPTRATGAHISLIGHVTADELRRYLDRTEAGNGFANRILWLCVRRSKMLPFGGDLQAEDLRPVRERLAEAVRFAREVGDARISFDAEAAPRWEAVYPELSEGKPGMLGAVTSRAEAQTVRLALLYALADGSDEIRLAHLDAALAVWNYCMASARFVFGDALGDPLADDLLRLLREATEAGMSREEIRNALGRHQRSQEIGRALAMLAEHGLARSARRSETGGRPEERWFTLSPGARYARKARKGSSDGGDTALTALIAQCEAEVIS